jgi:hypothetical protein
MPYTPEKPKLVPDRAELERRIPGWGADLDWKNRPAYPKENFVYPKNGAHWEFPERQIPKWPRERSTEHKFLTPVFGTACPPSGLSGVIRRLAYRRYSEGQTAHWLLLVLADRINVVEGMLAEALRGRPDNLLAEYGVASEIRRHGLRSRAFKRRTDTKRLPIDLLFFPTTWLAIGGVALGVRALLRRRR